MIIGAALILHATGEVLQSWPDIPSTIVYKGETRTGAILGAQIGDDAMLVARALASDPPSGNPPVNGETEVFDGSNVVVSRTYGAVDLAILKSIALTRIDGAAEQSRLKYITGGSGQALEYRAVLEEASRYVATGGSGQYPMLEASVAAGESADIAAAAALVNGRQSAWASIGANIRRIRISGKLAVASASSISDINSAVASVEAELP